MFSNRIRIWLAVTGLILIICSLVVLAFALRTPEHVRLRQTVIPTLLTPPLSEP